MKHQTIKWAAAICLFLAVAASCSKADSNFRDYLKEREIIYPGNVEQLTVYSGYKRVLVTWLPNTDPSIVSYRVFWNNGNDSLEIPASTHQASDTIRQLITGLPESTTNFFVYSYDQQGNRSTLRQVLNVKVYGDNYLSGLYNRNLSSLSMNEDGGLVTTWGIPDTVNVRTEIRYTNIRGEGKTVFLGPDDFEKTLPEWKEGTKVYYQSYYKPSSQAIDTFAVAGVDSMDRKVKDMLDAKREGWYYSMGTLDRPSTALASFEEWKWVYFNGDGEYQFQIAPSVFANTTLQVYMTINEDNTVNILSKSGSEAGLSVVADGACTYDPVGRVFYLKYMYLNASGLYRKFDEVLYAE
ncbi:DUF4998 domain-containing protein [Flavihumibacter petaseus]|uniref:Fibronectin type-III domain-containing protein n=1 Tax=Flavihumibacter petaseus NBRC 106054 TaxID=1220578 RepID=A0A0E9N3V4_9BACT|nr:DUF4998 domain-containing protein [Flavihumibacter petaseus]GAO44662.1 hypothetical protein FPE01S_03_07010 [Flavihumibacter petaseus NBRC 106054]